MEAADSVGGRTNPGERLAIETPIPTAESVVTITSLDLRDQKPNTNTRPGHSMGAIRTTR